MLQIIYLYQKIMALYKNIVVIKKRFGIILFHNFTVSRAKARGY